MSPREQSSFLHEFLIQSAGSKRDAKRSYVTTLTGSVCLNCLAMLSRSALRYVREKEGRVIERGNEEKKRKKGCERKRRDG